MAKLKVSDWLKVGNILGLKEYDLEIIKRQHSRQRDTSHACQVAMFGKWLRDHSSPTARDVIIALRKAGETRAADELSRKYGMFELQNYVSCSYNEMFGLSQERRVLNSRH